MKTEETLNAKEIREIAITNAYVIKDPIYKKIKEFILENARNGKFSFAFNSITGITGDKKCDPETHFMHKNSFCCLFSVENRQLIKEEGFVIDFPLWQIYIEHEGETFGVEHCIISWEI